MSKNIALILAAKQKRLTYWLERFQIDELQGDSKSQITDLLANYRKSISEAALEQDDAKRQALLDALDEQDRELNYLFENRRLLTSKLGIAALTDCSTRGEGS